MMKSMGGSVLLGYLWAFWDDQRQTWHDKAADTYVIKHVTGGYDIAEPPAPRLIGQKALWWALGGTLVWVAFQLGTLQAMNWWTNWLEDLEAEFERDRPMVTAPRANQSEGHAASNSTTGMPPNVRYLPPVFSNSSIQFPSGSSTIAIRSPGRTSIGPEGIE